MSRVSQTLFRKTFKPEMLQLQNTFMDSQAQVHLSTYQPPSFFTLTESVTGSLPPSRFLLWRLQFTQPQRSAGFTGFFLFQPSMELRSLSLHFIKSCLMR